jgi:nucleotide-binding universal stress UspA family protein
MRILVPLDGSTLAERAIEPAARLLSQVVEPSNILILISVATHSNMDTVLGEPTDSCFNYLKGIAEQSLLQRFQLELVVKSGTPADMICSVAHEYEVDMIMMSSHGRTGLARFAMGSVAESVARYACIPTFIVRPQGETFPTRDRNEPLTVLVPLDGTFLAETAIEPAIRIAQAFQGSIRLMRVLPSDRAMHTVQEVSAHEAYAYLTSIHKRLEKNSIIIHRALAWGQPAEQIIAEVGRHQTDLIVIATHGRTGLNRLFRGSIAERVLHGTYVPVLMLHPSQIESYEISPPHP